MATQRSVFAGLAVLALLGGGEARAAPPDATGGQDSDGGFWTDLREEIAAVETVRADFVEERAHPFRNRPSRFDGVFRYAEDLGMSLHYESVFPVTIILDQEGLLRRTGDSGGRSVPVPEEFDALRGAILDALRMDLGALEPLFHIQRSHEGEAWRMALKPRPDTPAAEGLQMLELEGEGRLLRSIRIERGPGRVIRIELSGHELNEPFPPEVRRDYFR